MIHTRLRMKDTEMCDRLLPRLEGRVFHVTSRAALPAILAADAIEPNCDGTRETTFGHSRNSYFRLRGCVSLFDLRGLRPEGSLERCWPFGIAREGRGLAIFVASPAAYVNLLPWTGWKAEQAYREMIVPHVEAGYNGSMPLALVEELLEVQVDEDPDPVVAELLEGRRAASARRAAED